jgi:very-short-patch-repair endonuclease
MESELTQFHGIVNEALDLAGIAHEDEYSITVKGKDYQLDCWLSEYHACIEADGKGHTGQQRKDKVRDALLDSVGIPTLRITQKMVDSNCAEELVVHLHLWVLSIFGTINKRRKRRESKDALWD